MSGGRSQEDGDSQGWEGFLVWGWLYEAAYNEFGGNLLSYTQMLVHFPACLVLP